MAAAALAPAIDSLGAWRRPALALALGLLILPNLSHLAPPREADVDLSFWTPRQLAARGFETTTTGEVTPQWMLSVPPYGAHASVSAGDGQLRERERTPFEWTGDVAARTASRIRLPMAYFPGWSVRVDGRAVDSVPAPVTGLIEFAVPAGEHELMASWGRSPVRRAGEGISLLAIAAIGAFALKRRVRIASSAAAAASYPTTSTRVAISSRGTSADQ
jgi:hypothetical protein